MELGSSGLDPILEIVGSYKSKTKIKEKNKKKKKIEEEESSSSKSDSDKAKKRLRSESEKSEKIGTSNIDSKETILTTTKTDSTGLHKLKHNKSKTKLEGYSIDEELIGNLDKYLIKINLINQIELI